MPSQIIIMKKFVFPGLMFFSSICAMAQAKRTFQVNPAQKIVEAIPVTALYSYPEFKMGTVALRNGTAANVKVNYNSVFGEMQFIDPKNGDTISLAEEKNIKYVAVEKDTFYYDQVWLRVIETDSSMKIAKLTRLEITNKEKLGAMEVAGFGAIETFNKYTGSQHMKDLVAKERITFTENITYYFGDRFNHFAKANKKSLINLNRSYEEKIEIWLKENKTDFSNEDDLKRLLSFIKEQ